MNIENFAPSCERNQHAILEQLNTAISTYFTGTNPPIKLLEIGSYSGQHAIHCCQNMTNLLWQPTDIAQNIPALTNNLVQAELSNCLSPFELDVSNNNHWSKQTYDIVFSANTLHIMSWDHVTQLFKNVVQSTAKGTLLIIYGPFKYQNDFTSDSNATFDLWLKDRDARSGIRDFEQVNEHANLSGFTLLEDVTMPANNQLLIWQKQN